MTGRLSKNFHGVGIGPLSKILAVKFHYIDFSKTDFTVCENSFTIITFKLILPFGSKI